MGQLFDVSYMIRSFPVLLASLPITLIITAVATVCGFIIGIFVALVRVRRIPILRQLAVVYVSFMRGTPFLVQLFLVYFGLPELLMHLGVNVRNIPGLTYVFLVFSLYVGAYSGEIIRSAIGAVSPGEREAALSLGMTTWQVYSRVVLPQAFRLAVPPLVNTIIGTVKGTSLIVNVGVIDIMRRADLMGGNSQRNLELYVDVAIIYGILIVLISLLGRLWERHYRIDNDRLDNRAATDV